MSVTGVIIAALLVGGTGLFIGVFLGIAGKKFEVQIDEREAAVRAKLPGNNCGGCGYPGCDGLAKAIASGKAPVNSCPVGGAPVAKLVGEIMGESAADEGRQVAFVHCGGDCTKSKNLYEYQGVEDCAMLQFVPTGGPKSCSYGCLGFGTCVRACPFDAIHIINGISVVDREACKACGKCVAACPQHIIELVPYEQEIMVTCSSYNKGKTVMGVCDNGCISCQKCVKNCPSKAIEMVDNVARIDYKKCTNCGTCLEGCPRKCIIKVDGKLAIEKVS